LYVEPRRLQYDKSRYVTEELSLRDRVQLLSGRPPVTPAKALYQDLDLSRLNSSGLHRIVILAKVGDKEGRVSDGIMTCTDTHTEGHWNRKKAGCLSLTTQDRNRISYVHTNARRPRDTPGVMMTTQMIHSQTQRIGQHSIGCHRCRYH
jgi:hypothetical protein